MNLDNNAQIVLTDSVTVRSGDDIAYVAFQILPKDDKQGFWINSSPFISVAMKETDTVENMRVLTVKAVNESNRVVEGDITVTLDNGECEKCVVNVLPKYTEAPRFASTPEIIFKDGKAIIIYEFEDLGENTDQSEISWYRVDKIDRSRFKHIHLSKTSNERDCRKTAVSRNGMPCREIRLTAADVGKHLKVNIKPKHNNSQTGQGLNIISAIVKPTDINNEVIILNTQTVVDDNTYDMEKGYFTVRGDLKCAGSFSMPNRLALVTESMGSGIYYRSETLVNDMSLITILEPEDGSGNGFAGPKQYEEIYIKYDPDTQNGYGLRIEGTASDDGKTIFCLYQYKNGNGTPISDEYESTAFRPGCEINLEVRGDILHAFITYDDGEDFADLEMRAKIRYNDFGGFGFKHMAETEPGFRGCLKYMEAKYPINQ